MDYIKLLNAGKTLICNYKETQTDTSGDSWNNEVWYKNDDKYICKYVNLDFITEHDLDEINAIWKSIKNMVECNEVNIDIIDNIKCNTNYDKIKNIPISEMAHLIDELNLTREFIVKRNLVNELNSFVKNNRKNS